MPSPDRPRAMIPAQDSMIDSDPAQDSMIDSDPAQDSMIDSDPAQDSDTQQFQVRAVLLPSPDPAEPFRPREYHYPYRSDVNTSLVAPTFAFPDSRPHADTGSKPGSV